MATDFLSSTASPSIIAGLFVAGLGAVYAYARLGPGQGHAGDRVTTSTPTDATPPDVDENVRASEGSELKPGSVARRRKKKKGRREGEGADAESDEASRAGQGGTGGDGGGGVPGDFESARADMDMHVDVPPASLPGTSGKNLKKKKKQGKGKARGRGKAEAEVVEQDDDEEGSETGKEGARTAHAPHSGDSTDASVSRPPLASASASVLGSSRAIRAGTKPAPQSHPERARAASRPREIRTSPSLSLDTDSSWTHVGRRRLEASGAQTLLDSVDLTSSDLASTASDSPVAERMDGADDVRGTRRERADRRTLAEKLVPRPGKTGVDDMLERPDGPALARVMQVQPRPDDVPVPGFSWEDYGDIAIQDGDSLLVHDADEEDEGEWGVVKSRRRNHTQLPETTAASSTSPVPASTTTKKQRQNARKRELAKSAKVETEAARLEGLAKHKRELEQVRAVEQSRPRI